MKLIVTTQKFFDARRDQRFAATDERQAYLRDVIKGHYDQYAGPIEAALQAVNGKATAFSVHDAQSVVDVAERAEEILSARGVIVRNRVGARVTYVPAGPSVKAYKFAAKSTQIVLERNSSGWRLVEVTETKVYPRSGERFNLTVSEAAAADITRHAFDGIQVQNAVKNNAN